MPFSTEPAPEQLPEELLDVLLFEVHWRADGGRKADAIRARFGFSESAYRVRLRRALEHEAAARIAPTVVRMSLRGRQRARRSA